MSSSARVRDDSRNGPAWAAVLAAGVGCAAFGAIVVAAEAFKHLSAALVLYRPSGDLSGKSAVAVVIWLSVWAILHGRWRRRTLRSGRRLAVVAVVLALAGFVLTLPPVFGLFVAR